jgi:hypothetical protein
MSNQEKITKSPDEWQSELTPEQYHVLREKGTETPFSGEYVHTKEAGMYACAACGNQLFSSDTKFDSGTGWPSFDNAIPGSVPPNAASVIPVSLPSRTRATPALPQSLWYCTPSTISTNGALLSSDVMVARIIAKYNL